MMDHMMRFDIDVVGAIFLDRPDLADGDEISDALEFMLGAEGLRTTGIRGAWQLCREAIHE